jgi:4-hydroxy-tetrahydrodipicolinate synthase
MSLTGTYTALVTPFTPEEAIDWPAYEALVAAQAAGGVSGVVPCGTTGESPSLTREESLELVKRTVAKLSSLGARGRVQVVAGTGSNCTKKTIEASVEAERAGADAVMVVVPYYNKPTQAGLYAHYVAVAKAVKCPVVVYNIPGRTGIDLLPDTLARIVESAPNVVCVKEATGNVLRAQELVRRFGDKLSVLSGDDALTLPMIACGARGVISVASNVLPGEVSRAVRLALDGDFARARRAHLALLPVFDAMFVEANPGPVKAALAHRGACKNVLRGPMAPVTEKSREAILAALDAYREPA